MKVKQQDHFPQLPFPNGEPEKLPLWQSALQGSRGNCPCGHKDLEEILYWKWEIVLRWIAKLKWNPTLEILDYDGFNNLKPKAEVLLAVLELCIQLHALGFGNEFCNAGVWWRECAREFQIASRRDYYFGTDDLEERGAKSRIAKSIKKGKNPFKIDVMPNFYKLAQIVIDHKDTLQTIFDDLYVGSQRQKVKGLGAAFSAWSSAMDQGSSISIGFDTKSKKIYLDKDGNIVTNGKGGFSSLKFNSKKS